MLIAKLRETLVSRPLLLVILFAMIVPFGLAQGEMPKTAQDSPSNKRKPSRRPLNSGASTRNPQISRIVAEIDARNIENTIRRLVSFGTRNTLSEQNNPSRGIGAARDWLYAEFQKAALQSEGRMTVEKQTFEQPKAPRVPQPTMLTNIVATLKGTHPESVNRVYVVSGHYDSMCSSPTDAKCDAPGANDDA